ncbi:Uncharacterised protein [Mycobacterium tuberculosis]|uniref:Uncharacterized protein n=1 Tax=Mycobacterium tuberculosis TaxID=1773 RepID=A0A916PCP7_MYCTX|nr:Uncharacterised protein [Mycobacterium tuberculosis]
MNIGPKLAKYAARPSTATAMFRYIGSLLAPSSAWANEGVTPP